MVCSGSSFSLFLFIYLFVANNFMKKSVAVTAVFQSETVVLALCFDTWCYSPVPSLFTSLLEGTPLILFHLQKSLQSVFSCAHHFRINKCTSFVLSGFLQLFRNTSVHWYFRYFSVIPSSSILSSVRVLQWVQYDSLQMSDLILGLPSHFFPRIEPSKTKTNQNKEHS